MTTGDEIKKILIFDDDRDYRKLVRAYLAKSLPDADLVEYDPVANGAPGEDFDWSGYDVMVLDYYLCIYGTTGLDILQKNRRKPGFPATIMLTGAGDEEVAMHALDFGVYEYLRKEKLTKEGLLESVKDAYRKHHEKLIRQKEQERVNKAFDKTLFYRQLEHPTDATINDKERVLLLIGIDNLDTLTIEYGLIALDNLLRHIARQCFEKFSGTDSNPCVTRLGDTSIGVLIDFPGTTELLGNNIRELCEYFSGNSYSYGDYVVPAMASIGAVILDHEGKTISSLIELAGQARDTARQTHENSWHIFTLTEFLELENKRQQEEEQKFQAEQERLRREEEARVNAEAERLHHEEEQKRQEEEQKHRAEEERLRREEEARVNAEVERLRHKEEQKRKETAEQLRQTGLEQQRQEQEARLKAEINEQQRQKAEKERRIAEEKEQQRLIAEQKNKEEERERLANLERQRQDEQRRQNEEQRHKEEEDRLHQAELEQQNREDEERLRLDELERQRKDEELSKQKDEKADINIMAFPLEFETSHEVSESPDSETESAAEVTEVSKEEAAGSDTELDEFSLILKKAFNDNRIMQTFQPVVAMFSPQSGDASTIFKVDYQLVDLAGTIKSAQEFYRQNTTLSLQQDIDHWMLREIIGRVVRSENFRSGKIYLLTISEAWLTDTTLFTWLKKLLIGVENITPGKFIALEIPAGMLVAHKKRALALIRVLKNSHGFRIALGSINTLEELTSLPKLLNFNLVTIRYDLTEKIRNTPDCNIDLNFLKTLKSRGARIIIDGIEDSTMLTDAISLGTDYVMGNFIGEPQSHQAGTGNVESFDISY